MTTAHSILAGGPVDTSSEAWRHECECRWLLRAKPTRTDKHLYLYGVPDRIKLMTYDRSGKQVLREDYRTLWPERTRPLMHHRGLEAADRILADARKIYEAEQK